VPQLEWKIDATSILTVLVMAGSLAVQWGVYSVRLTSLETEMGRISTATQQLTTAVTKIEVKMEEREARRR